MQNKTENTMGNAIQRTIGTFIGAAYGLIFILIKLHLLNFGDSFIHYAFISLTLIPIIYTTVVVNQKKTTIIELLNSFSCVVFLSIVVNHLMDENPDLLVLNRSLDTLIGIFVGLVLNLDLIFGNMRSNVPKETI